MLVPGIQGRWEWMAPTMDALAAHGRAITYSLCDEPTSGFAWTKERGFENYVAQLDDVLATIGARRPVLVGVSYGGLVAAEFAARHPERVAGLVIASAPPPNWTPDRRVRRYLAAPRLLGAAFFLGAPLRTYPELKAAIPGDERAPALRARPGPAGGHRAAVFGSDGAAAAMAAAGALRVSTAHWICRRSSSPVSQGSNASSRRI